MTRTEALKPIEAVVQYRGKGDARPPYWETIAGFNSRAVAKEYAKDCEICNPKFEYRAVKIRAARDV